VQAQGLLLDMGAYTVLSWISWLRARIELGCWFAMSLYMFFDCSGGVPVVSPESKSQRATGQCGLVNKQGNWNQNK